MAKRHLHLGVIYDGRIIQERLVLPGTSVSVGQSRKCTLTVPSSAGLFARPLTLFTAADRKYVLRFGADTSGVITIDDHEVDFATLRDKGLARKQGESFVLPLVDKASGHLELGSVIVVFDFIAPAPEVARLPLPVSVRSNLVGGFDGLMASALAVSSLVFGVFLLWVSTIPVPEEITFDQLDDRFVQMIMPKVKEPEQKPELAKTEQPKEEKKKDEKKAKKTPDPEDHEAVAERKKEIQQKVASKGVLAILGAKGNGTGAVADVFSDGKTISADIDAAFSGIGGVEVANGNNATSRGGGDSGIATSIGKLATTGAGKVGLVEKTEVKVGNVKLTETPEVDGSLDQADIARVVKGRLTAIKECYERELKRNPQLSGKVVVRFTIDEEGRVARTVIEENTLPDKNVAACIAERVERFRFPKPDGGSVTVAYPFIFTPST